MINQNKEHMSICNKKKMNKLCILVDQDILNNVEKHEYVGIFPCIHIRIVTSGLPPYQKEWDIRKPTCNELTNNTMKNTLILPYPSNKTYGEIKTVIGNL